MAFLGENLQLLKFLTKLSDIVGANLTSDAYCPHPSTPTLPPPPDAKKCEETISKIKPLLDPYRAVKYDSDCEIFEYLSESDSQSCTHTTFHKNLNGGEHYAEILELSKTIDWSCPKRRFVPDCADGMNF